MNGTRPMLFTFDNDGVAADFVEFIKDFKSDRGTATLHLEEPSKSTIVESLKVLGITSDKLTEQIISDAERGDVEAVRSKLSFVDRLIKERS